MKMFDRFIENAIRTLTKDDRIIGILAGGSYINKELDKYSDIDLIIVVKNENYHDVMKERYNIIDSLGNLAGAFTGEHVGEPRLIVSLYEDNSLHVDYKFVSLEDVHYRIEDPSIIWQKDNLITNALCFSEACFPSNSIQWMEDRFWIMIHYTALKIGRGELFETVDFISFLRQNYLGPLILVKKGFLPKGVRKIEFNAPDYVEKLSQTIPTYDRDSCIYATEKVIEIYLELREYFINEDFIYKIKAQRVALEYLESVKNN